MKILVGGSDKCRLLECAENKLSEHMVQGDEIFVGVGSGISEDVQFFLNTHEYEKVTVYVSNGEVFNSRNDWKVAGWRICRMRIYVWLHVRWKIYRARTYA